MFGEFVNRLSPWRVWPLVKGQGQADQEQVTQPVLHTLTGAREAGWKRMQESESARTGGSDCRPAPLKMIHVSCFTVTLRQKHQLEEPGSDVQEQQASKHRSWVSL